MADAADEHAPSPDTTAGGGQPPTVTLDTVPRPSWEVRRRRYGDQRALVRHNEIFQLDTLTDAVWRACGEGLTVLGIAKRLTEEFTMPPAIALQAAAGAVQVFADAGLVDLHDAPDGSAGL